MLEIMNRQQEIKETIWEAYRQQNYTIESPFFTLNPYQVCPLSGLVMFLLEQSATLEIEVYGKQSTYELEKGHQELSILGLKPNKDNEVKLCITYKDGTYVTSCLNVKTAALPDSYPKIEVRVSNKVKMKEGLFSLSLGRSEGYLWWNYR